LNEVFEMRYTEGEMLIKLAGFDEEFISTKQVKHILGCHEVTVYRYVQAGDLIPYTTTGRASLYKKQDVEAFIRKLHPSPTKKYKSPRR